MIAYKIYNTMNDWFAGKESTTVYYTDDESKTHQQCEVEVKRQLVHNTGYSEEIIVERVKEE